MSLEDRIARNRQDLERYAPGDAGHDVAFFALADSMDDLFLEKCELADLDEAIALHRSALGLRPVGHPARHTSLHYLALCLYRRHSKQDSMHDLEEAITLGRAALELRPLGHRQRAITLNNLADCLKSRFLALGENGDLDEAISLHRLALDLRSAGHSCRRISRHNLAFCLWHRYRKQATIPDLEEAITLSRTALERYPPGYSEHIITLNNLADYLKERFLKLGNDADLDEATSLHRSALDLCPADHSNRSDSLLGLALCLWHRYKKRATIPDLEEAIILGRSALQLCPPGHPHHAANLHNLADYLRDRFLKLGANADLDEAISLYRTVFSLCPAGHSTWSISLNSLVYHLSSRYEEQGTEPDLNELISLYRIVLDRQPRGYSDRATSLRTLLRYLQERLRKHNRIADLDDCISLGRTVLTLCETGHSTHDTCLHSVACDLYSRFHKGGASADLEEAITLRRAILDLHPSGHLDHAAHLNVLLTYLREMFGKFGRIGDINEAISLAQEALELRSVGDLDHLSPLCTLATFLSARFHKGGGLTDLEQVITLRRDILELSHTASSLHELALSLSDRFDQLAISTDIDEAIQLELSALQLLLPGQPDWALSLRSVALYRQKKFTERTTKPDLEGVRKLVMGAVYNALEFLPPRLLSTHTGIICDRDALVSAFENSQQYKQLLSLTTAHPTDSIRDTVSAYYRFVTLSHRWGKDEPLLRQIQGRPVYEMDPTDGLVKLQVFCATACDHGYLWAWSDTCCIDKDSTVELAKSIASMFSWYRRSALTIVHLSDITRGDNMSQSVWFTRGWTLQELLAPRKVLFYTRDWTLYKDLVSSNHKEDDVVLTELEAATGIARHYLTGFGPGLDDARSRLLWASRRRTTEPEDVAYSLFGIFNIFLPVIPGETAENALGRLLTEIISQSGDISVLDWVGEASTFHSCFPARIALYRTPSGLPSTYHKNDLRTSPSNTEELVEARAKLVNSLSTLELPQFVGRRLRLPCIVYQITAVQLKATDVQAHKYVHEIQADGLLPFEIALSEKLKDTSRAILPYALIRPWHSKLLASSSKADPSAGDDMVAMFGQPFSALLMEELSGNDYKRIASSSAIVACPADVTCVLKSKVQIISVM